MDCAKERLRVISRREFLQASAASGIVLTLTRLAAAEEPPATPSEPSRSWQFERSLDADRGKPVAVLAFSPNGVDLAGAKPTLMFRFSEVRPNLLLGSHPFLC